MRSSVSGNLITRANIMRKDEISSPYIATTREWNQVLTRRMDQDRLEERDEHCRVAGSDAGKN